MKLRNTILKTVAAAVAALGIASTDTVAQIAGPAPTTSSAFRMYNSSTNWITIAAGPTAGTGTFLWPAVSAGVFKSDATGTMSIGQINAADLALTQNSMFVGGPGNTAIELAAGTAGQVLQISGTGAPSWQTVNLIPDGGGVGQTLYWDGDSWESNNTLNVNPTTGDVTVNGDLTVSTGNDVILPNGVINNNELENSSFNVSYGSGITGDATVALGGTLNLQNTGVTCITAGTGISVSGATGNVTVTNTGILNVLGTPNQINVSTVAGVATLSTPQDIHTGASPTFAGMTLTGLTPGSGSSDVVVSNGGVLETRTMNILPNGGGVGQTLYWDGDSWETNNTLNVNPTTGDVTANGDLTVSTGNDVILPNGVINNNELENDEITVTAGTGLSGGGTVALGGTIVLNNAGILNVLGTPNQVNVSTVAGVATLSTPQDIHQNATPTFDGLVLDNLSTTSPLTAANSVLVTDAAGNVTETSPSSVVAAATLPQNNIYVGDATNHPAAVAPGSNGDVLTIVGSTPTWTTPTGTIAAKGKVTGTGTWTYTVNPGVDPSGASTIIMVTLTSTSGLQVTHVVSNITATTFDVQFPVNIGGTESFHWMVIQ